MRLLLVVNVDWFFLSHRLPVALGALQAGHEVHIATTLTQKANQLQSYGFTVHPIQVDRSGSGLVGLFLLFCSFLRLFWKLKPDVLHLVTIKPVLVGGFAARFSPVGGVIYAVSGLGHVFVSRGMLAWFRRKMVAAGYRFVLGARRMRIIFQNADDRAAIESVAPITPERIVMIPGSGVDLSEYVAVPLGDGKPVVMMAARLLATKGVREFVAAAQQLRDAGVAARFWLVGEPDLANPASIQPDELEQWRRIGGVELLGHRSDIAVLMAQAHIVVLPSYYGEGLPKVLIEAAACGRAIVTTDMPGCRDAIDSGVTGLLVPPRSVGALAEAIKNLVENPATCLEMGRQGRRRAEQLFDVDAVVAAHLKAYLALSNVINESKGRFNVK